MDRHQCLPIFLQPVNLKHKARPEVGVLEEIVKDAVQLRSVVDLVKHLPRLHPLVTHYTQVNLRKAVNILRDGGRGT